MKRLRNLGFFDFLQGPPKWVPILGELQKTLQKGEYLPLHPLPMFESNFVQVTHQGGPVYLHHDSNRLTMGVASTLPSLGLPDILLIARPPEDKDSSSLILTRMIPMDLVHLYVHDLAAWRLKLRLATGRYYYLELDAPYYEGAFLFDCWIRLINQLREPASRGRARTPHELRPLHLSQHTPFASTWRLQAPSQIRHHPVAFAKYNLPYKQLFFHKRKAKVLKRTFKSQAVGDSVPIWSHLELTESRESPTEKQRSQLEPAKDSGPAEIPLSEKPSITIRTIFSIISTTVNQKESSKGHSSEPGEVTICVTPPRCISQHSPAFSSVVAYDQLEQILWKQDIEDLMDTQSTTLTSSFSPNIHSTAFHRCTPYPSILGHKVKARPPASQKAQSIPVTSGKTPFFFDRSQKVKTVPPTPQKAAAGPASPKKAINSLSPSQNAPVATARSQKAPRVPVPSKKFPPDPVHAPSHKTPVDSLTAHKAHPLSVTSHKSPRIPVPSRKVPSVIDPSQKASRVPVPSKKFPPDPVPAPSHKTPVASDAAQKAPCILVPSEKVPSVTDLSQKVPLVPVSSPKVPPTVPLLYQKVPRGPVRTQKVRRIPRQKVPPVQSQKAPPSPSQKVPPAPIIPPSAPNRKAFFLPTSSQKALTSPAQYQRAFSPPPSLEKTPAEPSLWLAGSQRGDQLEGRQPEARPMPPVMVSTQKKDVVERRTQEKSLELPFSMTKKTSEEVLVSRTREMTIEELKGTGKSEERVIKKKEETTMDLPGLKSKGTEQRKMWVQTTELSLQGPPAEHRRPLSVEGLALAKLMIMARSQEQHSRPAVLTLPSWLSINAERPPVPQVASMSPKRSQLSWLEGSPVVVREQPEPVSWVEQSLQHWMGMEESRWSPEDRPRVSLRSLPASNRPSLEAAPKPPIPLPATKWEDLPQSTTPLPTPRVEVLTRSPQQLVRVSQEPIQMSNQQPLAMMGTSPDILLPLILETKGGRDTAGPVEVPAQSRYLSASQPSLPS